MLFFEDKPLAMRIIALFLMKFVREGLALRTRVSFELQFLLMTTKSTFLAAM